MNKLLCLTATGAAAVGNAASEGGGMDFTAVFLIISLIVAVALPVSLFIYGKFKCKGSAVMTIWGIVGYMVFYVILSMLLGSLILRGYKDQTATYFEGTVLIVIQFVCMEAGRLVLLYFNRKKHRSFGDALMMSAGYCLCDTLIITVFFVVPYLIVVLSPNGGEINGIWRELRVFVQDTNIVKGEEWRCIVKALTSLVFCAMQISSTLLMYFAVSKNEKYICLLPLVVDALIMIPNRLSSFKVWFWGENYVILPYLTVISVLCCLFTYVMYKKIFKREEY